MTIDSKVATWYGYISIGVLLILLAVVWFRLVDESLYVPILIFAALVIVSRIVLRVLTRRERSSVDGNELQDHHAGKDA